MTVDITLVVRSTALVIGITTLVVFAYGTAALVGIVPADPVPRLEEPVPGTPVPVICGNTPPAMLVAMTLLSFPDVPLILETPVDNGINLVVEPPDDLVFVAVWFVPPVAGEVISLAGAEVVEVNVLLDTEAEDTEVDKH